MVAALRVWSGLVLLGLSACSTTAPSATLPSDEDRVAIVTAVETLFRGMRTKDLDTLNRVLLPEASFFRIDVASGETESSSVQDFLAAVQNAPDELNEAMWDPEVRVDGPLAILWAPYGFHRGTEFSHWGYDAFHLVRQDDQWRIVAIAYTRRTEPMRPRTGR